MKYTELLAGYKKIIQNIYTTKPYYKRIRQFLSNYKHPKVGQRKIAFSDIRALLKSIIIIGIFNRGQFEYWKLFIWTLFKRPELFVDAITYAVYGYHYRIVFGLKNKN